MRLGVEMMLVLVWLCSARAMADSAYVQPDEVAAAAEVGAHANQVGVAPAADQALPLEAEVGGVVARHLHDHALDVHLCAARVELFDHGPHLTVQRFGRGDDQ
jgi:type II secretory pathway component PulM